MCVCWRECVWAGECMCVESVSSCQNPIHNTTQSRPRTQQNSTKNEPSLWALPSTSPRPGQSRTWRHTHRERVARDELQQRMFQAQKPLSETALKSLKWIQRLLVSGICYISALVIKQFSSLSLCNPLWASVFLDTATQMVWEALLQIKKRRYCAFVMPMQSTTRL